jgi:hypothetical protein
MEGWRKSTLKTMLDGCSWQYALESVYHLPGHGSPHTAAGTGFHKAMEEYEVLKRDVTMPALQEVAAQAAFEESKTLPMSVWFEHELDPATIMDWARESVRVWWEVDHGKGDRPLKNVLDDRKHLGSEIFCHMEHPDSERGVQGTIDALYEDDEWAYVVDFKTASSFRKWTYEQAPNVESALYLYMAQNLTDKPVRFEWHVVSQKEGKARLIDGGPYTQEHAQVLSRYLLDADVLARTATYRPRPEWNLCSPKWCAYFEGCRTTGTLSPYALTIQNVPDRHVAPSVPSGQDVELAPPG